MSAEMTKIEIITRQSKLEELKTALNAIGINGMTVTNVLGYGVQKGQKHQYRGVEYNVDLLPNLCFLIPLMRPQDLNSFSVYRGLTYW